MAKGFKLRITLPSLRICRSKKQSSMPQCPSAVTHTFTPVNLKTFDIAYPKSPSPPPSTPNHPLCRRNISIKFSQFGSGCASKFSAAHVSPLCNADSPGFRMKKDYDGIHKLCNSPVSEDFDDIMRPVDSSLQTEKSDGKVLFLAKDPATSFTMSISSGDSGCYSFSSEDCGQNDESEGLVSSCSSLDSSHDFGYALKTRVNEKATYGYGIKRKKKIAKVRRLKPYVSNRWKDCENITIATTMAESESAVRNTVFERLMPCMVDGKVNESFAMMKRSADPHEDFKKSMLEMILEKQLSEAEELEKLLMCFLSLNAREHHAAIVEAFTEVWEELFCKS